MINENKEAFWKEYKKFDKQFNTNTDKSYEYLVNFSQIANKPIHRWFYFQEGYSPDLIVKIFDHLNIKDNPFVFDPFAGSGTTLLTAKELGMKSFGFEINPFSAFMIRSKILNYSEEDLRELKGFRTPRYRAIENVYQKYELKIIENLFDKQKLEKIELLKQKIKKIENEKTRTLLFAGLLSILGDVSNYRKGGNGLKRKRVKKDLDPFTEFQNKINQIYNDLKHSQSRIHQTNSDLKNKVSKQEPIIINDSCLNMDNYDLDDIFISIFSPPYANCFDPFEVYKMELWVGEFISSYSELREKRKMAITSNLNADLKKEIRNVHRTEVLTRIIDFLLKKKLWDKRIPKMLDIYFYDMFILLKKLYQKTKKEGFCVIVAGNSAYGNLAIPTDVLLAQMGEKVGFNVEEIIIARHNETSSQQHAKLGIFTEYLRESLVVLKK